ncbi:MAG: hypothetical protein U0790_16855 [Isosphaeraceae bacterium]
MLYFSLILSSLLLLHNNWLVRRSQHAGVWSFWMLMATAVVPIFMMCVAPAAMIHSLFLLVAVLLWKRFASGGPYLAWSLAATVLAYGVVGFLVFSSEREYSRLRRLYPFESMEGRVRLLPPGPSLPPLSEASRSRLDRLEESHFEGTSSYRAWRLRSLHEDAVGLFINSPGFGVSRMGLPSASILDPRPSPVPPQPEPPIRLNWSPGDLSGVPEHLERTVDWLLDGSIEDFADSRRFGYVKDRDHVAGFVPHRFQWAHEPDGRLTLKRLELVSLLLHDEPVVYESPDLPRMDQVREIPTRPLDRFERHGLETLLDGEDIVYSESPEGVRMLGAVRVMKQCLACHGGRRGDLLGAFSYVLAPR